MSAETWNGAVSLATTGQARVNFFAKALRDTPKERVFEMLDAAWEESHIDTIKLIFYKRDCRGGAGEKQLFFHCMEWLIGKNLLSFNVNHKHIPEYGSWKDVLILIDQNQSNLAGVTCLALFTDQLRQDLKDMEAGNPISLAAKYAPSENKHFKHLVPIFADALIDNGRRKEQYRRNYTTPLRAYLNVVERLMCGNQWEDIEYSKVPSRAMFKLKKAFEKHTPERFQEWQQAVSEGKAKINSGQLDPPEIVRKIYYGQDTTLELLWDSMMEDAAKLGVLEKCLVVADVSASMFGGGSGSNMAPIWVSLAFGLMISNLVKGPFHNKIITFDTRPQFYEIKGRTLQERCQSLGYAPWGGSTNFQGVFDLLLTSAKTFNLTQEQMPSRIICISDMQFNCAGGNQTNFETVKEKYSAAGYHMPELVFWNVSGRTDDFPAGADERGVALVSGYNKSILKSVMTGKIVSPYDIMRAAIDSPRYDRLGVFE